MKYPSDSPFYFRKNAERERFYEIFFMLCRKYQIDWSSASEMERNFIEEVTRLTYAHDKIHPERAEATRPSFVS